MRLLQHVVTKHDDLIHDIAYDFYGKRLATCSSDQKIKIWDFDDVKGWVCTAEWKSHQGPTWKVDWAAPEFGQVLASCSSDRTVCIWEEPEGDSSTGIKKWERKATLGDAHDSILSVKFAPAHLGLKLATCSKDGVVRIYEAIDITNLSQWQITDQFEVGDNKGTTSITWNASPFDPPTLAVGSQDPVPQIWQYNDKLRKWEIIAVLGKDPSHKEAGHKDAIHDIAWAPNMGRSYHLVATASKDQTAKIWQIEPNSKGKWTVKEVASFSDHGAEVWRVEWNITGTVLATSGDDGTVRLWKTTYQNEWLCLNVISGSSD